MRKSWCRASADHRQNDILRPSHRDVQSGKPRPGIRHGDAARSTPSSSPRKARRARCRYSLPPGNQCRSCRGRKRSTAVVERVLDGVPGALLAVAGDFNAEASEMPLRLLCCDSADTGNAQLDGHALSRLQTSGASDFTIIHHGRRQMVDHILASRALADRLRAFRVDAQGLSDSDEAGPPRTIVASHHAPVITEFVFPA